MKRLVPVFVLVALVVGALVLTRGEDPAPPAVPALSIPRLDGGEDFQLASLAQASKPTLLWFWAPWCSVCNAEAPTIEALASKAGEELDVIAIGGRDDVENAAPFIAQHGLGSTTLLFDESMRVWERYRIVGQPGAILLDTDGQERGRWLGAFDTNLALEAAREL
jgi:thiol-disulfide isomerase/thioredoxin